MRIKEALMGRTKNLTSSISLFSTRFSLKAALVFCIWAMIRQAMTQAIASWSFLHGKVFAISAVVLFLFLVGANSAYSQQNAPSEAVLRGYVDSVVVNGNRVIAQGWVGVTDSSHKVVSLSIWFANTQVYEGRFERFERPDVVKETGRNDWLKSGWRIDASSLSDLKSGEYPVKVLAKLDNGQAAELVVHNRIKHDLLDGHSYQSSRIIWIARITLIVLFVLLCTVYFKADYLAVKLFSRTNYLVKPPVIFGIALFLSFWVLLSLGITGSSLKVGLQSNNAFVQAKMTNVFGKDRVIRSDEWLVSTPFAIAQYNHYPKFPVVNTNMGEDGQNMLVVGMTGVPVAHISSIAKPATWGFFLFDLKRALSWYWCFPIFACLLALWGVVSLLLPGDWRPSFLIALWFSVSPYVAAWSNWPAYAVFFPCLALISAIAILRSHNKYLLLALGCILGVDLAGFVLFLYPPWQVSLTYVFLALAVGIIVRDKLYRNFSKIRLASFGIAIIISSLILWKWWSDAHVAIQAMMATVYPGQRTEVVGGSMSLIYLLRGFTNIITLNKSDIANTNQCEIASFSYMLLPLVLIFVFRAYQRAIGAIEIALALSISVILYFMLAGIPIDVAKFSLWGRVPPNRAELALGLSNIILCGILLVSEKKSIPDKMPLKILVVVIALLWATIGNNSISRLDESYHLGLSPVVSVGLFFVTAIAGYWLASGKFREFIYLSLAWSVATTWPFNPIRIAPDSINASFYVNDLEKGSGSDSSRPILVLESNAAAVFLSAFGLPAINGVLYYPQKSLWEQLDKNRTEWNTYNRYQHLYFSGGVVENANHYQIKSTHMDVVRVVVDLERFDFRKTGARLIVGPQQEENALRENASLTYIKNENGWSWFQIRGGLNVN